MSTGQQIRSWFQNQWKLLGIICLVQVASHLPYMHLPAVGTHVWRQCNTLAVARNYAEEDMRIWLPRIDKRYHFPGTTGPSFTAYEYSLACIYRITGFSQQTHRWFSLCLSLLALAGIMFLVLSFKKDLALAGFSAAALMAIPEFYYHSINAIPDLMALVFMLWGWFFARKWFVKPNNGLWVFTTFLLTLAGMVKLQFLVVGIPLAVECLHRGLFHDRKRLISIFLMVLVVLGAAFAWYRYANFLTFQYWLNEFVHEIRFPDSFGTFASVLFGNIARDIPETWVGYVLLPGCIFGLVYAYSKPTIRWYLLASCAGAFLVYLLLQTQFVHHGYYTLFLSPFIAISSAYGYYRFLHRRFASFAIPLVLGALLWAWLRMQGNWSPLGWRVPATLLDAKNQEAVLNTTDTTVRYIVGPDQSGCVYFYYLHAKGFPWYTDQDTEEDMSRWVEWGARGLITDRPDLLANYGDSITWHEVKQIGEFHWYRIQKKRP